MNFPAQAISEYVTVTSSISRVFFFFVLCGGVIIELLGCTSVKYFSWKSVADAKASHKKRTGESVQRRFMVFIVVASDLVAECHVAIFQRKA